MTETSQLAGRLAGRFIVVDGPDGAGKGTQLRLLAGLFAEAAVPCLTAHDPGDTPAGDLIRQVLLHSHAALATATEALLFMASRAQLVAERIRPALAGGSAVLCDRFISATCAYQGAAGADPKAIIELGRFAVGDTWPDLTIILDLPAEEGLRRIGLARAAQQNGGKTRRRGNGDSPAQSVLFKDAVADSMENRPIEFHRRVREIFRGLPGSGVYPRPVELVDALGSPQEVHERIVRALAARFPV